MYSGEYDVCDVTLSVYPHRTSLKNMPGHGENRTYDLWNTSPMLCQLSCAVRTVRVSDIWEQRVEKLTEIDNNLQLFLTHFGSDLSFDNKFMIHRLIAFINYINYSWCCW